MNRPLQILLTGSLLLASPAVFSKPAFLKRAKELELPGINNCFACHDSTEKPVQWNARGLWLKARKAELNASEVDVAWLKDYKPAN